MSTEKINSDIEDDDILSPKKYTITTKEDVLHEYENIKIKINKHIEMIWQDVILDYKNNTNGNFILEKINDGDYIKFHNWFIKTNGLCQTLKFNLF